MQLGKKVWVVPEPYVAEPREGVIIDYDGNKFKVAIAGILWKIAKRNVFDNIDQANQRAEILRRRRHGLPLRRWDDVEN
jgi:hypothetical protein